MLLIKFPSRSRVAKMFSVIENIQAMIGIVDYNIALALDLDDTTVNNLEVKERLKKYDNLVVYWGLSGSKIQAINRSIPMSTQWKFLIVVADDMVFTKKGFGLDIIQAFEKYPDAGLLHFPDGKTNERLCTLPVISRSFYDTFEYVYNPEYVSVYADQEQQEVSKLLCRYHFINLGIFRHEHYRWGYGKKDSLNDEQDNPQNYMKDSHTFHRRKLDNFGIK